VLHLTKGYTTRYSTKGKKRLLCYFFYPSYDIMSVSEREQAEPVHRERRMAITSSACDIMFAEEKRSDLGKPKFFRGYARDVRGVKGAGCANLFFLRYCMALCRGEL
jgi:hypothetical protein